MIQAHSSHGLVQYLSVFPLTVDNFGCELALCAKVKDHILKLAKCEFAVVWDSPVDPSEGGAYVI